MRLLVTGGAGFIGSHLNDVLLARDHEVVCVDDLSKGSYANVEHNAGNSGFRFEQFDIRDSERLQQVGKGVDVVIHLAATKIPRYGSALGNLTLNIEGARSAIELARTNDAKFVLASTSDVYGKNPALPFSEESNLVLGPSTSRRWAYAVSKLCDEHLAFAYQDEYDLPVSLLRFFGSYGERQYLNWWGGPQGVFMEAIAKGEPLHIHGDGSQSRCFIYVSDLVEGVARAAERDEASGEVLNIGTEEEVTILDLAKLMHSLSGIDGEPQIELISYESFSKNYEDVTRRVPDLTKMRSVLDFEPAIDLEEGITRLWAWYRSLPGRG